MTKTKSAAIVTIYDAPSMSKRGRKSIAKWLRQRADIIEKEADALAPRFTSRYIYADSLSKA